MTTPPASGHGYQVNGERVVLVVDDVDDIREIIAECLEEEGYRALHAKDGVDALEALRLHPEVGVILLDLVMPVMDGRTFRNAQLADPTLTGIPVIVMSGLWDCDSLAQEMLAAGGLLKPFSAKALLQELRRHFVPE